LRAILVGGGALPSDLNDKALALGWPVLPSYGMSECSSTIAVCDLLLSHIEARQESDGRLAFCGPSLFTGYITEAGLTDPKIEGWFVTDDVGEVEGSALRVQGRRGDFIKIGGESVDLARLDRILESVRGSLEVAIVAIADDRLGNVIHLATTGDAESVIEKFNARVLPFERIRGTHHVPSIPRSSLGKLLRSELARRLTPQRDDDRNSVQHPQR
jgi:O-succinylbenzoic acid--CoA ligase